MVQAHLVSLLPQSWSQPFPSFCWRTVLEVKVWVWGMLASTEAVVFLSPLSWQNKQNVCAVIGWIDDSQMHITKSLNLSTYCDSISMTLWKMCIHTRVFLCVTIHMAKQESTLRSPVLISYNMSHSSISPSLISRLSFQQLESWLPFA